MSSQVVLKANPKYYGAKPAYEKVVIRNVEAATQKLNVQRGDSQVALNLSGDQVTSMPATLQVNKTASANVIFLLANQDSAISKTTTNAKFVEAVRKGVDYAGLLELAGEGSTQAPGVIPSQLLGALPADQAVKRDVEGAKAALAASGLTAPSVKLEYPTRADRQRPVLPAAGRAHPGQPQGGRHHGGPAAGPGDDGTGQLPQRQGGDGPVVLGP